MTIAHPGAEPGGPSLEIVALGGLGEFGLNMLAVSCGETTIVIDAGGMFAGPELPGVDRIVQDLTYLQHRRVSALVLTHGHEDHIGGVPYLMPLLDGKIYATPLTLAFIGPKLEEHGIEAGDRFEAVSPGDRVAIGPIEVEFIRVTHSMPDCVALALHTPAGVIVHTGDF
jgi:ribonuclease J